MRYSAPALANLDDLRREVAIAATTIQTKMAPGETAAACASRQFEADLVAYDLSQAFVGAMAEVYALGSSGDCISLGQMEDIADSIRQLFDDAAHKSWTRTRQDAEHHHLEAAE